ncbi:MAG: hypothetical protein SFU56_18840 [Capsulimonadales bacterium]|nr:hypothetical protein [Capsulimonadales bacterium]
MNVRLLRFDLPADPQAILAACAFFVLSVLHMVCSIAALTHGSASADALGVWLIRSGIFVPAGVLLATGLSAVILYTDFGDRRRGQAVRGGIGLLAVLVLLELIRLAHLTSSPLFQF